MQAQQLRATIRANTEQYERALHEIDAALQLPVERQFEIERRISALLATIASLKITYAAELPLLAAEQLAVREEEQQFLREQQTAIADDLAVLEEEMAVLQRQVHLTIIEVKQALETDSAYNEVKARQCAEAAEIEKKVALIRPALDKCIANAARYASSRVYAYLLSVGYGTPAYTGRGSAWLGDVVFSCLCRFARAQRNERTLGKLQAELNEIVEPAQERQVELQNWLHSMEASAGKSAGMDQLLDRISDVNEEIQHRHAQVDLLDQELAAFATHADSYYVHSHHLITEFLHAQDEEHLLRTIKRLPNDAGTEVATEWGLLKFELRNLRSRYAAAFTRHTKARKERDRAKALEFRVETACDQDTQGYRPALQINKLIDRYMAGTMSEDGVIQEIRRHRVATDLPEPA